MRVMFLFVLVSALSTPAFSIQHPPQFNVEKALLEVGISGGVQHRVVVLKSGRVKYYLAARNGYIAELNASRVYLIENAIAEALSGPQSMEEATKQNCTATQQKFYHLFDSEGRTTVFRTENECGYTVLSNVDPRLKTILDGLLVLGDLENKLEPKP